MLNITNEIGTVFIIKRLIENLKCSGPVCNECIFNIQISNEDICLADLLDDLLEDRIGGIIEDNFRR